MELMEDVSRSKEVVVVVAEVVKAKEYVYVD